MKQPQGPNGTSTAASRQAQWTLTCAAGLCQPSCTAAAARRCHRLKYTSTTRWQDLSQEKYRLVPGKAAPPELQLAGAAVEAEQQQPEAQPADPTPEAAGPQEPASAPAPADAPGVQLPEAAGRGRRRARGGRQAAGGEAEAAAEPQATEPAPGKAAAQAKEQPKAAGAAASGGGRRAGRSRSSRRAASRSAEQRGQPQDAEAGGVEPTQAVAQDEAFAPAAAAEQAPAVAAPLLQQQERQEPAQEEGATLAGLAQLGRERGYAAGSEALVSFCWKERPKWRQWSSYLLPAGLGKL